MKLLVVALIAVSAQASMACLGEAQIIAKVQSISKTNLSCVAYVNASSIVQYNQSVVCSLDLSEVFQQGVEVGLVDGHDCRLQAGDMITGVLVKTASGQIVLE